jgi:AmpE protein
MNFLALVFGLLVERLLTQLFHLRQFRWLDPLFDLVFDGLGGFSPRFATLGTVVLAGLLVLPVALLEIALIDRFAYVPAFLAAVAVLLFCLGPGDLIEDVEGFQAAAGLGDTAALAERAGDLLERVPTDSTAVPDIERAIYAQANNRIFGVVFWFIVLGAAGAWLFRVLDLMRRRASSRAVASDASACARCAAVATELHRILAWLPARLLMMGYAMAGSYDGALHAWRQFRRSEAQPLPGADGALLGAVGHGAAAPRALDDACERSRVALDLVTRTLWMIWSPVLALLTLYDWIS